MDDFDETKCVENSLLNKWIIYQMMREIIIFMYFSYLTVEEE